VKALEELKKRVPLMSVDDVQGAIDRLLGQKVGLPAPWVITCMVGCRGCVRVSEDLLTLTWMRSGPEAHVDCRQAKPHRGKSLKFRRISQL